MKQLFSSELIPKGIFRSISQTQTIALYRIYLQYLHVLQDSKHYMTHPTAQVHRNSQVTDIPLTERHRLKDDHLSTSLRFFNLPLGIGLNDRGSPFKVVIRATVYLSQMTP